MAGVSLFSVMAGSCCGASSPRRAPMSAGMARTPAGFDPQGWGALFRRWHPVKPAEHVAAAIGAPVRSVENWMEGRAAPSLRWFLALVSAYGPDVLAHAVPGLGWLDSARQAEEARRIEAEMARLSARHAALTGSGR